MNEAGFIAADQIFASRVIAPNAAAWDAAGTHLPRDAIAEWVSLGLQTLQVSRERGGGGCGYGTKLLVAQALAAECFASAFAFTNMQGHVTRMEREGSPDQVARYLPSLMSGAIIGAPSLSEPEAGSDFAAITTRATPVAAGWRLDGEKAWITNGAFADQVILYAQTDPGAGADGIASFIVDLHAPGVERLPPEDLVGGSAIGAAGIRLTSVHVPAGDLFAPAGQAFRRALTGVTGARIHVSAMLCATVRSALGLAVSYGGERRSFGRPLLAHQGLRWQLADIATGLEAAELLTARAAELFAVGSDARVEAAFAKKFTVEMATRGLPACMQAMGAVGLRRQHPLGRHMVAARIAAYVDGTTEMQNERIGAALEARYAPAASASTRQNHPST